MYASPGNTPPSSWSFVAHDVLEESVVNTTAFVLGLSLSDVRAYRLEPLKA